MRALRYALLAMPVLGLAELAAQIWFSARPPAFDDWFAVEGVVRALKQPNDVVVIAPPWADPAARRALGDDLMPLRDVARPDLSRYDGAVEVSVLGQHVAELGGWKEQSSQNQGKFSVRRVQNPAPAHLVFDFVDHVSPPIADVRNTEPPVGCAFNTHAPVVAGGLGGHPTFPRMRFDCPGSPYLSVGVTVIADEEFRPRRCIWSHPPARGEVITRFRDVALGDVIRGHGGLYWIIEREKRGAPISLSVRVDGDTVGTYEHRDGDGWKLFEFPLNAHKRAHAALVEFAVSSPDNTNRHFCFEADTR